MPAAHCLTPDPLDQGEDTAGIVHESGLAGDDEHGCDAFHRDHANETSQGAAILSAERVLHGRGEVFRVPRPDRQQRIRLTGQDIDIERPDEVDQCSPRCRFTADQESVAAGIGYNLGTGSRERLQCLQQILRPRIS